MFGVFRQLARIRALEERLDTVTRDFKALELDYNQFYDKARSMMQRIAKRAEVAEKLTAQHENGEEQSEVPFTVGTSPAAGRLTDRQRQIQQQILRRRAGG